MRLKRTGANDGRLRSRRKSPAHHYKISRQHVDDTCAAREAWAEGYSAAEFAAAGTRFRSRPALRLDKGGNLMTRLVLAALVLLNCASFTTKLFAQASPTAPPVPLTAPSVSTTTLTCQINCDTQAMSCQNSCVPTTAAATSGATGGGAGETGYVEGRDAAIEFHWADSQYDRLPAWPPSWCAAGGRPRRGRVPCSARGQDSATSTIPIVFSIGVRPGRVRPRYEPEPAGGRWLCRHRGWTRSTWHIGLVCYPTTGRATSRGLAAWLDKQDMPHIRCPP